MEGYLTTHGRGAVETYRMIRDAGFVVERADGTPAPWAELGLEEGFRAGRAGPILKDGIRVQTS